MRVIRSFLIVAVAIGAVSGCATKSQTGAAVGAGGGAVVGGVIGKITGNTTRGAIIGAAVGGVAGAVIGARMDKQARELEQNIPGARVERVGEGIAVVFDSGLLYDFDSDVVRPQARDNLRELARSLDKYPGSNVMIAGHTDDVGADSYNMELSRRRASAASAYLASQGVAASRISTRGLGESEPLVANDTDAGRQANRRVEVAIFAGPELKAEAGRSGSN
jgi:outer membrane protein OmpA-like peptidoglycan-associated protein